MALEPAVSLLRSGLEGPARLSYDHRLGANQPAQLALRKVSETLKANCPPGYKIRVSGHAINLPVVPWIAILDPDQTDTPQEGIYVVYLYSADMTWLYLSLNQGYTAHKERAAKIPKEKRGASIERWAIESVQRETQVLRRELAVPEGSYDGMFGSVQGSVQAIDLRGEGDLALGYQAGHITGFSYETAAIPDDKTLRRDLFALLALCQAAGDISDRHSLLEPETWTTRSGSLDLKRERPSSNIAPQFDDFKPRDFSDITVDIPIPTKPRTRTRKHEALIARFGADARAAGLELTNKRIGKMDLLMRDSRGNEWLVEAKSVTDDGESAVRDAIGQLFAYRHEYYTKRDRPHPHLLALLNRPVAQMWLELLEELGIGVISWNGESWSCDTKTIGRFGFPLATTSPGTTRHSPRDYLPESESRGSTNG